MAQKLINARDDLMMSSALWYIDHYSCGTTISARQDYEMVCIAEKKLRQAGYIEFGGQYMKLVDEEKRE